MSKTRDEIVKAVIKLIAWAIILVLFTAGILAILALGVVIIDWSWNTIIGVLT